ncbi:MAG: SMI1/KNR4 family protein [Bacteroidota bacterium]
MYGVLGKLNRYKTLGEQRLEDGTLLIGRAPHIAPQAWLHSIYPPLTIDDLAGLATAINAEIPEAYRTFLQHYNGLKIFNTTFCLYGLRRNSGRSVNSVWQPFNIIITNTLERPKGATMNMFFIGGYDWDGSLIYIDNNTGEVHLCDGETVASTFKWPGFEEMLDAEISRLITLFDDGGKALDEDASTLPGNLG